jgi:predicted ATP-grasp superfamily ATP-dependent carboligase
MTPSEALRQIADDLDATAAEAHDIGAAIGLAADQAGISCDGMRMADAVTMIAAENLATIERLTRERNAYRERLGPGPAARYALELAELAKREGIEVTP